LFLAIYFALSIANSVCLILIFLFRKFSRIDLVKKMGYGYFALALPAIYLLAVCWREAMAAQYAVFLGLFICYLLLEWLYDFVLNLDFRRNWKLLVPYLVLYYAMNYGFFAMLWKNSKTYGLIVLALILIQIVLNFWSHKQHISEKPQGGTK
jgi:hypothetical protein